MRIAPPLAAVLRALRAARGLSQEKLAGPGDASHIHLLENDRASATLGMMEGIAERLDVDLIALLAYASKVGQDMGQEQYLEHLRLEMDKIGALGVDAEIHEHFQDGHLVIHKPGRPARQAKIEAVLKAKAAGKSKREVSDELGIPWSTVNDIWKKG
ncbi:helix-turn-helix domain-containing protein [Pseudomonas plecoglossicida]